MPPLQQRNGKDRLSTFFSFFFQSNFSFAFDGFIEKSSATTTTTLKDDESCPPCPPFSPVFFLAIVIPVVPFPLPREIDPRRAGQYL